MPLTTIDPRTALVVVDLQRGVVSAPLIHPVDGIIRNSRALIDAFRKRGLPVVLVNVAGRAPGRTEEPPRFHQLPAGFSDLIPELDVQPTDILITKHSWGAFANTDLAEQLRTRGVTQVVLAGLATGTGVESTARQAYEAGFHVTLAIDAMSDTRPEAHAYSLASVFPRLGESGSTDEIIHLVHQRNA